MIEREKLENYLLQKRNLVVSELNRETDNNKKIALYAMLGVIDAFLNDIRGGVLDSNGN
ncbi:MAG: hypothetical protein N2746_04280 [Deltaproteobacteria bacterium]|nr:hypothetical protein [Deltaproteobacteria bacterium]